MNHATHPLPAEMIGRSTRTLTPEQRSALEESDCGKCGKAASDARHVLTVDRAGRILGVECVACWRRVNQRIRRLLLFGVPDATRAQILAAAREKVPA